jgi:hypothetical protein
MGGIRMSSSPSRKLEIWKSSIAENLSPISGAFYIHIVPTIMVNQTLEFLNEGYYQITDDKGLISGFLSGMRHYKPSENMLIWSKTFDNHYELFNFDFEILLDAIRQLEIHTDINITYSQITYLADVGTGPNLPLMAINRVPFGRGIGFEIEERSLASQSIQIGDFEISSKVMVSQQHYSTGMGLLAGEDSLTGLIDAAFMQFYLSMESLLESHEKDKAIINGERLYGGKFTGDIKKVVEHVYLARHRFFGHAHPKYIKGLLDTETAFDIAKQCLVARWVARALLSLELNRPLVVREMRLFHLPNYSVCFFGSSEELRNDFKLP